MRAQIEERVLAAEFREAWWSYCERVPMLMPNFLRRKARAQHEEQIVPEQADIEWQKLLNSQRNKETTAKKTDSRA